MAKLIDIESVLREKMPNKNIPGWALFLLKKIIHQEWMNVMLRDFDSSDGIQFSVETLKYLDAKMEYFGLDRLPLDKKYIFVSNHPLGGLDGVALASLVGTRFGNVRFLVNELLMYLEPLRSIAIPIHVGGGRQEKSLAEKVNEVMDSDKQLIMFPAGACSRFQMGKGVCDLNWKKTFVSLSVQYQRDVVPIYFEAHNSFFFYALAFIRKTLGIKINIEMLFLVHEMYKNRHKTFRAYFGKPISYTTFVDSGKSPKYMAAEVRDMIFKKKEYLSNY